MPLRTRTAMTNHTLASAAESMVSLLFVHHIQSSSSSISQALILQPGPLEAPPFDRLLCAINRVHRPGIYGGDRNSRTVLIETAPREQYGSGG